MNITTNFAQNAMKRNRFYRKLLFFGILISLVIYYYIATIHLHKHLQRQKKKYFIYKSGCHIEGYWNAEPEKILDYYKNGVQMQRSRIRCAQLPLLLTKVDENGLSLELNLKDAKIVQHLNNRLIDTRALPCMYGEMQYVQNSLKMFGAWMKFNLSIVNPIERMPYKVKVVRVICFTSTTYRVPLYEDLHFYIPAPEIKMLTNLTQEVPAAAVDVELPLHKDARLSVMILGIDSMSHLRFLRQMLLTASYLRNPQILEYWGFNTLGSDQFYNQITLLSGLNRSEFMSKCLKRRKKSKHKTCPILWRNFHAAGYVTAFGEDNDNEGLMKHQLLTKIGATATLDFNAHAIFSKMSQVTSYPLKKQSFSHVRCSGARTYSKVLFDYIEQLVPHMQLKPFFSYFWWLEGLRNSTTYAGLLDAQFLHLFERFAKSNILNNTFIVFMSNHGSEEHRNFNTSYPDQLEYSQPFLFLLYPDWLEKLYPTAIGNLKYNTRSLVTNYDLFETLNDIIELKNLDSNFIVQRTAEMKFLNHSTRGVSLFLPMPVKRNCKNAGIPAAYCLCNKKNKILNKL